MKAILDSLEKDPSTAQMLPTVKEVLAKVAEQPETPPMAPNDAWKLSLARMQKTSSDLRNYDQETLNLNNRIKELKEQLEAQEKKLGENHKQVKAKREEHDAAHAAHRQLNLGTELLAESRDSSGQSTPSKTATDSEEAQNIFGKGNWINLDILKQELQREDAAEDKDQGEEDSESAAKKNRRERRRS